MEQIKSQNNIPEPIVKTMPPDSGHNVSVGAPATPTPTGMPGVALDPGLASRLAKAPRATKARLRLGLIIPLIILLILIGVGAWWYYAYGQAWWLNRNATFPEWGNYKENLIVDIKIHDIKSKSYDNQNEDGIGTITNDLLFDNFSFKVVFDNHQVGDDYTGKIDTVFTAMDINFEFDALIKKIAKDVYILPGNKELSLPLLSAPLDLGEDWVTFSTDQFDQWINEYNAENEGKDLEEYLSDIDKKQEEFYNKVLKNEIFTYQDTRQTTSTAAGKIRKFEYTVAPEKVEELVQMLNQLWSDNKMEKEEKDFLKNFFQQGKFSFWINTKTKFVQRVEILVPNLAINDETMSSQLDLNMFYEITEAEAVAIIEPKNTINFQDFFNRVMSQFMSPENNPAFSSSDDQSPSIDSDNDGLPDDLETIYGTDPQNPDTDGDSYNDAQEIENGYNPLGTGRLDTLKM